MKSSSSRTIQWWYQRKLRACFRCTPNFSSIGWVSFWGTEASIFRGRKRKYQFYFLHENKASSVRKKIAYAPRRKTVFSPLVHNILSFWPLIMYVAGENVTICYVDPSLDALRRRRSLLINFIECRCKRCKDPTEFGSMYNTVKCIKM